MENFKRKLSYICIHDRGYLSKLNNLFSKEDITKFEDIGFLSKIYFLNKEIWIKNNFADKYFKDVFGLKDFIKLKLHKMYYKIKIYIMEINELD